jgi:hypothetical protein
MRRLGICVDDREEITTLLSVIARPNKEVGMTLAESADSGEYEKETTSESTHGGTL